MTQLSTVTKPLTVDRVRLLLMAVVDPEIPVVTIEELGVLRDIEMDEDRIVVSITPTYSGCPALDLIKDEIATTLSDAGFENVEIRTVYSPAWTTDWLSPRTREKLLSVGIAPPGRLLCPRCSSDDVTTVSQFGSTACKSLMVCDSCGDPFSHFKRH